MRVLMISDFYWPHVGGLEQYIRTLSHELVRRGHHVAVATLRHHDSPTFELDAGVRVHRLAGWNRVLGALYTDSDSQFHPPVPDPGVMAGLRRVVEHERPDIVHAHAWMLYSFLPLKAWSRAKLVFTHHQYSLICPKMTYLHHGQVCTGPNFMKCVRCASAEHGHVKSILATSGLKLSSQLHRYVDRYIAVGSAVRDAFVRATGLRSVELVPGFISDNAADEGYKAERPAFLPSTDDYILFAGRQYAHGKKGLDVLLDAYAGLSDLAPLVAIIAGDPPQRLPDRVTLVRNVPHEQVMAAWAHCAVGVVPSVVLEAFPLVAVEAMACGKPVVASAIGGLRDSVVDGETGLLVPPGDAGALHNALRTLLADPARRARMGAAARERARLFTAGVVTDRIEQIYLEVLGQDHPVSARQTAFQIEE